MKIEVRTTELETGTPQSLKICADCKSGYENRSHYAGVVERALTRVAKMSAAATHIIHPSDVIFSPDQKK